VDYLVVEGMKPWDGRYEFDLGASPLTTREWGWIKRLSGYMPLTIDEGFDGGDPELFSVFAAIALRRAGKVENREVVDMYERIIDSPFETTIRLESDTPAEGDAGPPEQSSNGSPVASGLNLSPSSESSEPSPSPSGTPGSGSMEFDRPTSAR
jgi:hypothetical protein